MPTQGDPLEPDTEAKKLLRGCIFHAAPTQSAASPKGLGFIWSFILAPQPTCARTRVQVPVQDVDELVRDTYSLSGVGRVQSYAETQ